MAPSTPGTSHVRLRAATSSFNPPTAPSGGGRVSSPGTLPSAPIRPSATANRSPRPELLRTTNQSSGLTVTPRSASANNSVRPTLPSSSRVTSGLSRQVPPSVQNLNPPRAAGVAPNRPPLPGRGGTQTRGMSAAPPWGGDRSALAGRSAAPITAPRSVGLPPRASNAGAAGGSLGRRSGTLPPAGNQYFTGPLTGGSSAGSVRSVRNQYDTGPLTGGSSSGSLRSMRNQYETGPLSGGASSGSVRGASPANGYGVVPSLPPRPSNLPVPARTVSSGALPTTAPPVPPRPGGASQGALPTNKAPIQRPGPPPVPPRPASFLPSRTLPSTSANPVTIQRPGGGGVPSATPPPPLPRGN